MQQLKSSLGICDENGIRGWVIDTNNPNEPLEVEIFIDGELVVRALANIFRQDLLDVGIGNGRCAFHVAIPNKFFDGIEHSVAVKEVVTGVLVTGSPKIFILKSLRGLVDFCDENGIGGWAIDMTKPHVPVELAIFIDEQLVVQVLADAFRKDLLDLNIDNNQCAFHISIPNKFFDGIKHKVEVRETTTDVLLSSSPKFFTLKKIYLTTILDKHKANFYGCVEIVATDVISGWVITGEGNTKDIILEILINDQVAATVIPSHSRKDVGRIFDKWNIKAGFEFHTKHFTALPSNLIVTDEFNLDVRIKTTSYYLNLPKPKFTLQELGWSFKQVSQAVSSQYCRDTFEALESSNTIPQLNDSTVKLIAYYLPQFHPIIENDEWWGAGFTEWTNVAQAVPYFKDHYQPHVPSEFGYYDLRLPEIREAQAKLAKEYGIYGFCYYYYYFAGRKLLERPLQEVVASGKPDFPFCICWANENWSRRWDGSEHEILVQQIHDEKTDADFIHDVIPLFKDPRYIKINGAPLLIIYRISLMPNPIQTAQIWRSICSEQGIPDIHLCMAETFGLTEPRQYGFNSAVQFPPHDVVAGLENDKIKDLADGFIGNIYDFEAVIADQLARDLAVYKLFPGVMTGWDNTARRKKSGNIFINSSPKAYEVWLRGAIDRAKQSLPQGEQLVFINAWNEWAEGTHLEPDKKNGRGYLEATRRALLGNSDWQLLLNYADQLPELSGVTKKEFFSNIRFVLDRLFKVNERLLGIMGAHGLPKQWTIMRTGLPMNWTGLIHIEEGLAGLDFLNHYNNFEKEVILIDSLQKLWIYGWAYHDANKALTANTPTYIVLKNVEDEDAEDIYFAPLTHRVERSDVVQYYQNSNMKFSGVKTLIDISQVPAGNYRISVACRVAKQVIMTPFKVEIEIV